MLVIDHSGSMAATDVQPTRLAAAERAANTFIDQLPANALVGAIAFSTAPDAVQAPVANHAAARAIDRRRGRERRDGDRGRAPTRAPAAARRRSEAPAVGDRAAVRRRRERRGRRATVARQAAQDKIPIDTVALGTPNGTLPNPDPFGPPVAVPPDPQLMQADRASCRAGARSTPRAPISSARSTSSSASQLGSVTRKREVTAAFAIGGARLPAARRGGRRPAGPGGSPDHGASAREAVRVGVVHGLGAVARADLREHVVDVGLDRGLADHQGRGDLARWTARGRSVTGPRPRAGSGRRAARRAARGRGGGGSRPRAAGAGPAGRAAPGGRRRRARRARSRRCRRPWSGSRGRPRAARRGSSPRRRGW